MRSFLFEQYGYYPVDLDGGRFFLEGWEFRLIKIDDDKMYIEKMEQYSKVVRNQFNGNGAYIIRTRAGQTISGYDGQRYSLVCVRKTTVTLEGLNKFHVLFKDFHNNVDLRELLLAWEERVDRFEKESIFNLRKDGAFYSDNLEKVMFCMGMCQNAIQYLSDIIQDYGGILDDICLTHMRLNSIDSFDFFNPFNFVLDHPLRDLAELYRNNFISFEQLESLLQYYKFDTKVSSIFVARLLYSINILDIIEENIYTKEKNFKLDYDIDKEFNKIKKVYLYFKDKYNIRPILWLEV